MRFWDSSAIVPLILAQPRSAEARAWLAEDGEIVVWWTTPVECASAIARLHRDGHLTTSDERVARELLVALQRSWFEIQPGDGLRDQALRLLRLHPLRAADALQLAAAIEWAGSPPAGTLLTFNDRLQDAAAREGFTAG
ncbi:MAG: PIN domain-containing protein [Gemmatimonadales bacterium]